ncbi:helix-turn-helix domain-containing protein [Butyricicoccus intestinisimiae]|uniref:Helix-turn-helix domain-containing protein n=1 Tax=Butyricicoccus intestinisimiae TaxID=2841509 RepID=A0ABS6EN32_9FIRM|nr:LexA family transcriptional regulator [Butyricicoccus intestinisimiae]MBU5489098.1 helix-turn-helix domain-containing protein [Butyricicoccus intestinisimiae]MCI6326553.1 helix-turn-helix domain-containing protein [Clostridiales bacterium]
MTLGNLIKKYRKEHSMSQQAFADLTGLSKAYISILERNFNPVNKKQPIPSVATIKSVATAMNTDFNDLIAILDPDTQVSINAEEHPQPSLPPDAIPYAPTQRIPILGRISAGLPLYADEQIEGYTYTDLNHGGEYFALRVHGDSMDALGIKEGYLVIVRRQDYVDNGTICVVLVGDNEATMKRFYQDGDTVTLMPQSTNPKHMPQIYNLKHTPIHIIGKVVKVEFTLD